MDVVVTDHHRPGERLPPCPVVHPAPRRISLPGPLRGRRRPTSSPRHSTPPRALTRRGRRGPRPGRARHGRATSSRSAARTAASCARAWPRWRAPRKPGLRALMRGRGASTRRGVDERALGFRLGAADQRRRADPAGRRRARAPAHRGRGARGGGGRRARPAQPRAPRHRDAHPVRGRGRARRAGERAGVRARGRGLAPRRDRDRGVAAGRALPPPLRGDRAGRRQRPRLRRSIGASTCTRGSPPARSTCALRRPPRGRRVRDRPRARRRLPRARSSRTRRRCCRPGTCSRTARRRRRARAAPWGSGWRRSSSACARLATATPARRCSCRPHG